MVFDKRLPCLAGMLNNISKHGRMLVAASLLHAVYAVSPIDAQTVLALDGTTQNTDLSAKSNVSNGAGTPTVSSIRGQSGLTYSGGAYTKAVLKSGTWTLPTSFTVEAEVLVPAAGTAASGNFFSTKQADGTTTAWSLQWATNTGLLKDLTFYLGTTAYTFKTQLAPDQWVHVAVSRDASKALRLFVNGVLVNSFTNVSAAPAVPTGGSLDIASPVSGQNASEYMRHILVSFGKTRYTATFNADAANLDWPGGVDPTLPKQSVAAIDTYTTFAMAGDQLIESSGNRHVALDPASLANAAVVSQGNSQGIAFTNPNGANTALRASKVDGWALPNVFTLETDVYLPAAGAGTIRNILGVMPGLTGNCGFKLMVDATNTVSWTNENKTYSFGRAIWSDEWITLAVTQDASNAVRMFINGEMVATATRSNGCSSTSLKTISPMYQLGVGDAYPTTTGAGNAKYLRHVHISQGIARYVADYNVGATNASWPSQTQGNTTPVPPSGQLGTVDAFSVLGLRGDSYTELSGKSKLYFTETTSIVSMAGYKSIAFLDLSPLGFSQDGTSVSYNAMTAVLAQPWLLPAQFTIETDVYVSTANTASNMELIGAVEDPNYGSGWQLKLVNGKITFSGLSSTVTSVALTKGKWSRIAVVRDLNNTVKVFLNGVLVTTATNITGKGDHGFYDGQNTYPVWRLGIGGFGTVGKQGHPFYQKNVNVSLGVARYAANYNSKAAEAAWGQPNSPVPVVLPNSIGSVVNTYAYSDSGQLIGAIDGKGNLTAYSYNTYRPNDLANIVSPLGVYTQFGYDSGVLISSSASDPGRSVSPLSGQLLGNPLLAIGVTYTEDGFGNIVKRVSPDTGTSTAEFNDAGSLTKNTDAAGRVVTYGYDVLERISSMASSGTSYTYQYGPNGTSAAGKLTSVDGGGATLTFSYDALARLDTLKQVVGGVTLNQQYTYNNLSQLSGLLLPSGAQLSYEYDKGRLVAIKLNGQAVVSGMKYGAMGSRIEWQYANGLKYQAPLDEAGRIAGMTVGSVSQLHIYSPDGNLLKVDNGSDSGQSYVYLERNLGASGAVMGAVADSVYYGYKYVDDKYYRREYTKGDAANQVNYTYDGSANRVASLSGAVAKTYTYDAAGYLTTDGTITNTWTDFGQLASSTKAGVTTVYEYDGLGHRFRKGAASKTVYAYDAGGKLFGEYDAAGTPQREYIYLDNTPIAVWTGGKVYALHPDHLGSPRVVTDNTGAVVWNWKGEPFGATAPTGSFALNLRHPGQYYDAETGWFFNNARYYDPALGQYISSDPIGLDGGINTYAYVGGNPLSYSDPLGLAPNNACMTAWTVGGAACGGAVGYGVGGAAGGAGAGAACTLVAPGVGTVGCGAAGASAGSTAGGALGAAAGSYLGNKLGNLVCSSDDKEDNAKKCEQKRELEEGLCEAIALQWGKRGVAVCKASAFQRYSECLRNGPGGVRTPLHGVDTPL